MNRVVLFLFFIVVAFFAVYIIISTQKSNRRNLNQQFYGVVEDVRYDQKGIPYVRVSKSEYYLDAGYNFEHKIAKGDSIFKCKGSNVYKLTKPSGEEILFKN